MAGAGVVQRCLLFLLFALFVMTPLGVPVSADSGSGSPDSLDALHEVTPGDTLHLIAGYYYEDARQWVRIRRANRQQVPNPNVIERGALLLIPAISAPDEDYAEFVSRVRRQPDRTGASAAPQTGRRAQ